VLEALGIPVERWSVEQAAAAFPSFKGDDLAWVLHEPEAGVLRAQRAVQALAAQAQARSARIVRARARPHGDAAMLDDGSKLEGDRVVWSCGGWLAGLFPDVVQIAVTCQELFFFDGGPEWSAAPGWVDYDRAVYGTGDVDALGVKVAWDAEGPPADPDGDLPATTPEIEGLTRGYARDRFPALADAPLLGSKTCRYELSPNSEFIAAPHPEHPSVWIVGGGSGHGFKHGPAMAERLSAAWHGGAPLPGRFALGARTRERSFRTAGSNLP
jgi:glycine/D-amino acid oxidase-like deaminating enzyme